MTEKAIYEAIKNNPNASLHNELFTTNIFGVTIPIKGRNLEVTDGKIQVFSDGTEDAFENSFASNDVFSKTKVTNSKINPIPKTNGFTTEKLDWYRENNMLLDSKFDRLAIIGDRKKKEEEEKKEKEILKNTNKENVKCTCKIHSKAKKFKELIELVKDAEIMLIKNELTDIEDRINCIRGIYYGAEWSLDYSQEKSRGRNAGFRVYTTYGIENDARKVLKCSDNCKGMLFESLFQTPEVIDTSTRVTDFGHLMIGLDARRSYIARFTNLPFGGTGLENVTWVGDIGGGAGMLAYKRALNPTIRAKKMVFDSAHDYGCSINIEGDIAAYIVGINKKEIEDISDATDNMKFIYEGLKTFFDKNDWTARVNYFIGLIGGKLEKGKLINRDEVLEKMIDSVEGMAQVYITLRVNDKSMDKKALLKSFGYMNSCAKEVSEIFLDGLLDLRTHPNTYKFRAVTDPKPTIVDNATINAGIKKADEIISKISKILKL